MPLTTDNYETAERARLAHLYATMSRRVAGQPVKPAIFTISQPQIGEYVVERETRNRLGTFDYADVELDLKEAFDDEADGWLLVDDVRTTLDGLFTYEEAMARIEAEPHLKAVPYFKKADSH